MQFSTTLSRADLQAIPAKRRLDTIRRYIDQHLGENVQAAAAAGKTSYLFVIPPTTAQCRSHPPAYVVTPDDIVEGLKVKFPDCRIEFSEEWVETRPGVREHRAGILIDWS
jgi:hypothetical protein